MNRDSVSSRFKTRDACLDHLLKAIADIREDGWAIETGMDPTKVSISRSEDTPTLFEEPSDDPPPVRPALQPTDDIGMTCNSCGGILRPNGPCFVCTDCGDSTGCG